MKKVAVYLFLLFACYNLSFSEILDLITENGTIYGTLDIPKKNNTYPLVIIVSGSGPTDRNGNNPSGLFTNVYKMLAEELLKNNIASLRYDKRGIGASINAGLKEEDLTFEDYINDLILWIRQLKKDKRFNKIYIAGHSEGALIGMIAVQKEKCHGFISIAGSGIKTSDLLIEQLEKNPNNPKSIIDKSRKVIDKLLKGKTVKKIPANLLVLFRPSVQPYLISLFKYDPVEEIAKISIPILILQGTEDIQVLSKNSDILANANKKAILKKLKDVNHVLKKIKAPSEQLSSYSDPNMPISKQLIKEIINFIK